jgi:Undecaprenyl-phosphate glucose phosphotransferase
VLLTGWVLTVLFVTVTRLVYSAGLGALRGRGFDRARVLIVGTGPNAQMVEERLRWHKTLGYTVVGMVDVDPTETAHNQHKLRAPVLGGVQKLAGLVRKHNVEEVILALSGASDKQLRDIVGLLEDETVSVKIYPDAFQLMTQNEVSVGELSGLPLLNVRDVALRGWNRRLKRAFDILFSLLVLVLTSPFMLLIALAIKLSSPGPVFFIQERVGLDGKPFQLVKFRTMKAKVDEEEMPKLKDGLPGWTVRNDPRRTRIGSFLRRFSLDELPQFYNVLVGEMSVVGPRPEQPAYVQEFAQKIPKYLRRHREKAGITGWAQVNGLRGDSDIATRTQADLYYVEHWSVLFDLKIIVRTIWTMVRGKNAY